MNARFLPYDWFKFIVLLILIALLITLGRCTPSSLPEAGDGAGVTAGEAGEGSGESVSGDSAESEDLEQAASDATGDDAASGAADQTGEAADQSEPAAEIDLPECQGALPARISGVGARVQVTNALIPLRSSPEVAPNILGALPIGSVVEITSLPVCTEYLDGANLWWGVRTSDGRAGFAAEGSAISPTYYLEEMAGPE